MNYRIAQLLAPEDLGATGTKVIDIDLDQPISQILIRFQTTKASQGMSAGAPANITKIEIVDGSTVLWSATGYECQAAAYYNRPGVSMEHGQHISTLSEADIYLITFGRWLWDEVLAFLPSRYRNPQLRVTFNEDVSDTSVTANELEVLAYIFDEKQISPIGFLSLQEWFDYTVGANNSYETVILPEDHVIRQILVRAYADGIEPWAQIKEARLDENNEQRIPWHYTSLENYYRAMKSEWPLIQTQIVLLSDTGGYNFYVPQTDYWSGVVGLGLSSTTEVYHDTVASKGGKISITGSGNVHFLGTSFGYLPWHCFQFPMGMKDRIEDWYDPRDQKPRLRLRAGSTGTSGTGQVVLEQLRRY